MIILLMGVAGSGKTTIGRSLASELGWTFYDADELHPPANVEKMARAIPLDDADRAPWLETLRGLIRASLERGRNAVLACSALKERYRERLIVDDRVRIVYLAGSRELLGRRLADRRGHFLPAALLDSQLADLEEPNEALRVDVTAAPTEIVAAIRRGLGV